MRAISHILANEVVERAERLMLEQPQAPCNVRHIFGPGLYVRELTLLAGTFAVGHYQKRAHLNVMAKGRVRVMNEDGSTTELAAPQVFVGKPGRKIGLVIEDMVWLNVYATEETSIDKLEETYLDKSEAFSNAKPLLQYVPDGDYEAMLSELGVTAEQVEAESQANGDQVQFPLGAYKVKIGHSAIHGYGLIATADIAAGEYICPVRIGQRRTPAGRYANHAKHPNARMVDECGLIALVALRPISGCRGGQDGEEITVDYRESVRINLQSRMLK